ncbi:hypothetical protein V2595_09135 [Tenacibaculum maritimum]|nr:hypothetical protein [Tenacibaculum maritimum]
MENKTPFTNENELATVISLSPSDTSIDLDTGGDGGNDGDDPK